MTQKQQFFDKKKVREQFWTSLNKLSNRDTQQVALEELKQYIAGINEQGLRILVDMLCNSGLEQSPYAKKECIKIFSLIVGDKCPEREVLYQQAYMEKCLAFFKLRFKDPDQGVRELTCEVMGSLCQNQQIIQGELLSGEPQNNQMLKLVLDLLNENSRDTQTAAALGLEKMSPYIQGFQYSKVKQLFKLLQAQTFVGNQQLISAIAGFNEDNSIPSGLTVNSWMEFQPFIPQLLFGISNKEQNKINTKLQQNDTGGVTTVAKAVQSSDWMVRKIGIDALKCLLVVYGPILQSFKGSDSDEPPLEQQIEQLLEVVKYDKVLRVRKVGQDCVYILSHIKQSSWDFQQDISQLQDQWMEEILYKLNAKGNQINTVQHRPTSVMTKRSTDIGNYLNNKRRSGNKYSNSFNVYTPSERSQDNVMSPTERNSDEIQNNKNSQNRDSTPKYTVQPLNLASLVNQQKSQEYQQNQDDVPKSPAPKKSTNGQQYNSSEQRSPSKVDPIRRQSSLQRSSSLQRQSSSGNPLQRQGSMGSTNSKPSDRFNETAKSTQSPLNTSKNASTNNRRGSLTNMQSLQQLQSQATQAQQQQQQGLVGVKSNMSSLESDQLLRDAEAFPKRYNSLSSSDTQRGQTQEAPAQMVQISQSSFQQLLNHIKSLHGKVSGLETKVQLQQNKIDELVSNIDKMKSDQQEQNELLSRERQFAPQQPEKVAANGVINGIAPTDTQNKNPSNSNKSIPTIQETGEPEILQKENQSVSEHKNRQIAKEDSQTLKQQSSNISNQQGMDPSMSSASEIVSSKNQANQKPSKEWYNMELPQKQKLLQAITSSLTDDRKLKHGVQLIWRIIDQESKMSDADASEQELQRYKKSVYDQLKLAYKRYEGKPSLQEKLYVLILTVESAWDQ